MYVCVWPCALCFMVCVYVCNLILSRDCLQCIAVLPAELNDARPRLFEFFDQGVRECECVVGE